MTGYSRDQFGPAWTDDVDVPYGHNGCDTRNDVLRRDLVDKVIEPGTYGCVVLSGMLRDPYTAVQLHFVRGEGTSELVPIDHLVALGDAWQTGAQRWSPAKRQDFANDPLELLSVDEASNDQKGDSDAASWLPANRGFWCRYVALQVAVKAKYRLWVTAAEHAAMARVLGGCPRQPLPVEPGGAGYVAVHTIAPPPPTTPATAPPPSPPQSSPGQVAFVGINYDPPGDDDYVLDQEWIRLVNHGGSPVTLGGWSVSDASIHRFVFPGGFTLLVGATVTVHTGSGRNTATDLYWGEGGAVWNNSGGDTATLRNAAGSVVDVCRYSGGGSHAAC